MKKSLCFALLLFSTSSFAGDWFIDQAQVRQAQSKPSLPNQIAVAVGHMDGQPNWTLGADDNGAPYWWIRVHSSDLLALHLEGLDPVGGLLTWGGVAVPIGLDGQAWTDFAGPDADLVYSGGASIPYVSRTFHPLLRVKALGDSGSCNLNARCASGGVSRNVLGSVVALEIDNQFLCSGVVLNNTANDRKALVATARHCQITPANEGSVRTSFGFESEGCFSGQPGDTSRTIVGSDWLAESPLADTTLILLSQPIPASFGAVYAGWDARAGARKDGGFSFHHPSGDQKKFSRVLGQIEDAGVISFSSFSSDTWGVLWADGVTEQGSSGGPLFNADGRAIGVLSGGASSCTDPGAPDFYGKLNVAFDESAAIRSSLDPVGEGAQRFVTTLSQRPPAFRPAQPPEGFEPSGSVGTPLSREGGGGVGLVSLLTLLIAKILGGFLRKNVA